jgi:hypothetical protein
MTTFGFQGILGLKNILPLSQIRYIISQLK